MVALAKPPSTLNEAYDVFGKEVVEGPGMVGVGRIADYYDESGNLIQGGIGFGAPPVTPSFSNEEVFEEPTPIFTMPVYNRQPYSNIYGIVNTNASQDYLQFLRSLGIEI